MARNSDPRSGLIRVLRSACSGELAAGYAYQGHAKSVASPQIRDRIRIIEEEEWHHRSLVLVLLTELGAAPSRPREALFWLIGRSIAAFCRVGGFFLPMYGAGLLEQSNIREYEDAARLARDAHLTGMIDCLLTMAEVEWEHERFFREQIADHWMLRLFPLWKAPPPKEAIRAGYSREISPATVAAIV